MLGLKAFLPGVWNGEVVPPQDVTAMAANYAAFAAGDLPYYLPYVSINHDDGLSFGRVTAARIDPADGGLVLDLDNVPAAVREWMRSDRLTAPSVEYWVPGTFVLPDGSYNTSPVLRCVTLLGNDAPGVKGLPPLSAAQFRDAGRRCVLKFADLPPATRPGAKLMDRTSMLKTMADMGADTSSVTDGVPDTFVKSMLDFAQKCMADKKKYDDEAKKTGTDDDVKKNADDKKDEPDGDEEVKKYRDKLSKAAKEADTLLATLRQQAETAAADRARQAAEQRAAAVKRFRDEMVGVGGKVAFMTPDQFAAVEPMLLQLDGQTVRKFADGKTDGTALDEQFARLRASFSKPVKTFGDKHADGSGTGSGMSPERRRELLKGTPEGDAILAREKAAAKA